MWHSKGTPASAEGSVSESSGASTGECICYREWPNTEIEAEIVKLKRKQKRKRKRKRTRDGWRKNIEDSKGAHLAIPPV